MKLRIHLVLLSITLLLIISACGTTPPVTTDKPVAVIETAPEPETRKSTVFDLQSELQRNPSERSLEDVIELSRHVSKNQPEVSLEVLRSLESIPSSQLTVMIDSQVYDPEFTEWLELALASRQVMVGQISLPSAARKWADYHYGHPVTESGFSELIGRYSQLFPVPAQVAVLLPTDGGLSSAARAIRDGILSAYLEEPGNASLRFYSSGVTNESAIAAYLQARDDGATQIVGPLRNGSAGALASLKDPSVPILLLNKPNEFNEQGPERQLIVNSLTLSQTEEAEAIARSVLAQDRKKAIVIVPDSEWGKRIETAFSTEFEVGEGEISASTRFNSSAEDYSDTLTRLLKIDESKQRKADLQARLGMPLSFEPSRREDFDFIFMAASPKEGRELKPLLRFHDVGEVPVYAMGRIYSGRNATASDQDLNGIVFPITDWQLHSASAESLELESLRGGAYGNLFALGQDAWQILPWLPLMQKDPDLWYPGDIGELRMTSNGHLQRQPQWAQFLAGQPVPYEWSGIR